ncbi:hypothetical protein NHQ30_007845 [Ciborinia camelliae]|nr:hypothetical protein NHQ30_007845 [Ciborinia camelliae]
MIRKYSLRTLSDGTVSVKIHNGKDKFENMVYCTWPRNASSDDEETLENFPNSAGDGQKRRGSKGFGSGFNLTGLGEDDRQSGVIPGNAPASKKQKRVSFADKDDVIIYSPTSVHPMPTSQTSGQQDSKISGGIRLGDPPQRRLRSPPPFHPVPTPVIEDRYNSDFINYPLRPQDNIRKDGHKDDFLSRYSGHISSSKGEQDFSLHLQPPGPRSPSGSAGVEKELFFRRPDPRPAPKSLPTTTESFLGPLNYFLHSKVFTTPTHTLPPRTQHTSSSRLSKDRPVNFSPSSSSSPSPTITPKSILKPSPTPSPSPPPRHPLSTLQSLNPYFSPPSQSPSPSSSPQPSGSPSTLQSLNPYFSNKSAPPPKFTPLQQTPPSKSSSSPQSTKQDRPAFDYFQAARLKATPSSPRSHPLYSPLLPPPSSPDLSVEPPSPPDLSVEPPSQTYRPYSHRPPPVDRSDRSPSSSASPDDRKSEPLSDSNSNSNSKINLKSKSPSTQPQPPPSPPYFFPSHPYFFPSPPPSSPSPSPPPHPLHFPSSPPPSLPTPTPTPPLYYSTLHPLPAGHTLQGALFIPPLAHAILPPAFLACRTVRQLIVLQGWLMSAGEWEAVRRVLEREGVGDGVVGDGDGDGDRGARGNLEVLVRGIRELGGA